MAERSDITSDHEWHTNTDHVFEFTIYQADGVTPQNVLGWELSWFLKRSSLDQDADALIAKNSLGSPSDITIVNPTTGRVDVAIDDLDTLNIRGGVYYHELKRTDADQESVESYGTARLKQSLHRL
jgi:hypothetical protein